MTILKPSHPEIDSILELFTQGRLNIVLKKISQLNNDFPDQALLSNISGACHVGLGQLNDAIKCYEDAIAIAPDYAKAHYNLGGVLHEMDNLDDAIQSYQKSLIIDPDYAEAHNNLGNIFREIGQFDDAMQCFKNAVNLNPDYIEAQYSLAITLHHLGDKESIEHFEKVVDLKPDFAEAHNNLGVAFREIGKFNDAAISYEKAVAIKKNYAEAHNNLGNVLKDLGKIDESIKSYKRALDIKPDYPTFHNNLGNAFRESGESVEAIQSFENAIDINSDLDESYLNLGDVYRDIGKLDDAIQSYKKALSINPKFAEAHNNLGIAFNQQGKLNSAVKSYEKALSINPNYTDAHNNFGVVLKKMGRLDDSILSYKKALAIDPDNAFTQNNLGNTLTELEHLEEAIRCFELAISLKPDYAEAYNNLAIVYLRLDQCETAYNANASALEYKPRFAEGYAIQGKILSEQKKLDEALLSFNKASEINPKLAYNLGNIVQTKMRLCNWDNLHEIISEVKTRVNNHEMVILPFDVLSIIDDPNLQKKASVIYANDHYPESNVLPKIEPYLQHSKIRVGYFSSDFKDHPVATLTAELYELHNRSQFEIHAFSFGVDTQDEMNVRIKAGVDYFHDVQKMSNKDAAMLARSLEIDIAIDLGGFTANSRTGIFAMRAAPIQASYIGLLATMGADYYDYLLAGEGMIPVENQKYFVEKIVYLPSYQVNDSTESPPKIKFTRKELGLPEKGFVFCCFNNTYKITPDVFDTWARILEKVDNSIILIYAENKSSQTNLRKEIELRGIDSTRLFFGENLSRQEYLARYRVANLFLDTHPYNAGTTASDALRMGLPVLTLKGSSFNSREATAILNALNLTELITETSKEYESLAIEMAINPKKYKEIKDKLVANLTEAPLYDTPLFTKNLESAYEMMCESYHHRLQPEHIYLKNFSSDNSIK